MRCLLDGCGEEFEPRSTTQKYCSTPCRNRSQKHRARFISQTLVCAAHRCQNKFHSVRSTQRFCTPECQDREHHRGTMRRKNLRSYGLTEAQFEEMFEKQDGRCAICHDLPRPGDQGGLVIDHDHQTGKVRGLLCRRCNTGIGQLRDDVVLLCAAIEYLYLSPPH